jgi:hypothetical protein
MNPHTNQDLPTNSTAPARFNRLDGKTFAIGVLSVTACVLLVGIVLTVVAPTPAYAIGQNDRGGDYVMLTQYISNTQEGVVIVDAAAKRMNMYILDHNRRKIVALQVGVPLDRLPGARQEPGTGH